MSDIDDTTIFRIRKNTENPYVMIDKRPLQNPRLSWKAKGILAYLLSLPDDWEVRRSEIASHATDGEASFRSGIAELKAARHIEIEKKRDADSGMFSGSRIVVYEYPIDRDVEKPHVGKTTGGFSTRGESKATNIDSTNNDLNDIDSGGETQPPSFQPPLFPVAGSKGSGTPKALFKSKPNESKWVNAVAWAEFLETVFTDKTGTVPDWSDRKKVSGLNVTWRQPVGVMLKQWMQFRMRLEGSPRWKEPVEADVTQDDLDHTAETIRITIDGMISDDLTVATPKSLLSNFPNTLRNHGERLIRREPDTGKHSGSFALPEGV